MIIFYQYHALRFPSMVRVSLIATVLWFGSVTLLGAEEKTKKKVRELPSVRLLSNQNSKNHFSLQDSTITLSGSVTDSLEEPLVGASILVKGGQQAVKTDQNGRFSIPRVALPAVLRVSYVGYKNLEVPVKNGAALHIRLETDAQLLDEVQIGYGSVKRRDITGAVSQITAEVINERPVQNVMQAMQGKVAGADITSSLRPGGLGDIRIRGNRSIRASNEPLYVVDGIPLSADEALAINPKDIASIEILKDASATAIYGSRGANGVILISYKEGKKGEVSISYDGSTSFDRIHSTTDWMNSAELLDWQRQAAINGGTYTGKYGTAPDPDFDVQQFGEGEQYGINSLRKAYEWDPNGQLVLRDATQEEIARGYASQVPIYHAENLLNQNWTDLVTRTGITQNHALSLSSGTETSRLYLSVGYLNQKGAMIDQDYNRYTFNLKGDVTPRKWITVGLSANGIYSLQNYGMAENSSNSGGKDSYGQALSLMPYAPAFDENGNVLNTNRTGLSAHNVLLNVENATNEHKLYSVLANANTEIRFSPWLKYSLKFGAQFTDKEYGSFYGPDYTNPFSAVGTAPLIGYNADNKRFSWVLENLLSFNRQFGIHDVHVDLLQSAQRNINNGINIRAQDITFPTSLWYSLQQNGLGRPMGYGTSYSRSALMSYMARVNYGLLDKYLLTATGRWDGASVLAAGHKWDFFPSLALAWKLEQEPFIQNLPWINQLKLRYGWGITGNSSVSPYTTKGTIEPAAYVFNETQYPGYKSSTMPNQDLGWEKTAQHNIGLDFAVLNSRVSGSLEFYRAQTKDLLMSRSIPPVLGFNSILTNVGRTENKGIEISISTVNVQHRDFSWRTDFLWSANREKIVELADGKVDDLGNGWYIGQPISVFRDYKYDRLWQANDDDARLIELYQKIGNLTFIPGQVKVKDQDLVLVPEGTEGSKTVTLSSGEQVTYLDNGFGKIDDSDRQILGSNRPKWVAGFTNTFTYKNFEFAFFLYARMGNLYYGALQTLGRRVETDTWSPQNPDAKYPQATTASFSSFNSARNYVNGSLIALRYVSLSYTFPKQLLGNWGVRNLQVYGQVLNPFIWGGEAVRTGLNTDDVEGWDTAAGAQSGGQTANTILLRSFVLGLRVGL